MSETLTINQNIDYEIMICGECGIQFAPPTTFVRERREDGGAWYCPNGHRRIYSQREVDRLKEKLATQRSLYDKRLSWLGEDLTWERNERASAMGSLRATKGVVTKLKRRIAAGICPCCQQRFLKLEQHIATEHPDWEAVT